ncbi:MAG: Asp-tRNA(Asn)/Glu-tRNA(Gln) amidotransferase subunit GatC [Bacteroidia bacterium]|nr:Asp-tRNA(Asn)/Glu-tRNA(Gln) amidotransferase subunit GatC [Bacteroidia bacterium]
MKIDNDTVDKIAHLARLEFENDAKSQMINDMNNMLSFIDKLNELDTSTVEPLIYISEERNVLRSDEVKHDITQQDALKNAPKKDSDYFKVPKVIDK